MMHDGTRGIRRPRRARPAAARTAVASMATAALALLAAACSGGPSSAVSGDSPNAGSSATSASAIAYSHCMRSHGVPNFPDPSSSGQVPKTSSQLLGVSSSQLQAAQTACRHLYPSNGGALTASLEQCEETGVCPQVMVQRVMNGMRKFARCMRSHGAPDWPDPSIDSEGRPGFNLLHVSGFDPNSRQIDNKMQECEYVMPGGAPVALIRPGRPG